MKVLDPGASGYSSLQPAANGEDVWLFYEQSDEPAASVVEMGLEALIGFVH